MTCFVPAKDGKAYCEKRTNPVKITIVALTLVTLVAVFWPFIVELTAVRLLGLLAGANFLALQFGMLLSLLKNSMVRHVLQPRAKSRRSLLRERHEVSTVTRF